MRNAEQAEHWGGAQGHHWVAEAARYRDMLRPFGEGVVSALAPAEGERIIDVGCGNGDLSLTIAGTVGPTGEVLGVDLSEPMLANAKQRAAAEELDNVRFENADAQTYAFAPESFDGLVSRFGVMFFDDPGAAFTNLATALRPGGRLAFVCWQDLLANEYVMVPAVAALEHVPMPDFGEVDQPGPFALADPEKVRAVLQAAGLSDIELQPLQERMRMGSSADDVVQFFHEHEFADALFKDVPDEVAERAWLAVRDALQARATSEGVVLSGTAWLVTAQRGDATPA